MLAYLGLSVNKAKYCLRVPYFFGLAGVPLICGAALWAAPHFFLYIVAGSLRLLLGRFHDAHGSLWPWCILLASLLDRSCIFRRIARKIARTSAPSLVKSLAPYDSPRPVRAVANFSRSFWISKLANRSRNEFSPGFFLKPEGVESLFETCYKTSCFNLPGNQLYRRPPIELRSWIGDPLTLSFIRNIWSEN